MNVYGKHGNLLDDSISLPLFPIVSTFLGYLDADGSASP